LAETFPIRFGRYELVERLAVGGMAEVFLATVPGEHGFAKNVVIKRLLPHLAREPGYTAMFIDEAKLTARLVHPKIAQTYELGRVGEQLFIAMEMVDGVDVLALLREFAARHDRMPPELAVWIAHEVLDALEYAHTLTGPEGEPIGVVHRDISPSNVLLSRRGDIKLVDFGIARAQEPNRHHRTKSGTLKGKYGYMSPEQVLEQPVDARSDIFSVGIVLAEMLMGRRLFAAPNELDVLLMVRDAKLARLDDYGKHIDKELDGILRKALEKQPQARWSSAAEMRDAIDDWLFQKRLRVTPKRVAEVVEGIYEQVKQRRRATVSEASQGIDQVPQTPLSGEQVAIAETPVGAVPRAPTSAESPRAMRGPEAVEALSRAKRESQGGDDSDGIPRGMIGNTDSLPIVVVEETPAPLDIAPPVATTQRQRPVVRIPPKETSGAGPLPQPPQPPPGPPSKPKVTVPPVSTTSTPVARTTTGPVAQRGSGPIGTPLARVTPKPFAVPRTPVPEPPPSSDVGPSDDDVDAVFAGLELGPAGDKPVPRADTATEIIDPSDPFADLALDLDPPSGDLTLELPVEPEPPAGPITMPLTSQPSVRYSSIEAAVSALSRNKPDASTTELDGSLIPGKRAPTGEVPALTADDLRRAAKQPPPRLVEDIEDTPEENGDFGMVPPLKVLYRLTSLRQTGLLVAKIGAITKEIYIRDGMPEYVSSNISSELFGNWLVQQGVLSQGELAMALAMMPHYGGKLGDTLVGLGLLKPLEVFRHLTRQVRQKLIDVCTWNKGQYSWYSGRINPREAFPLDLNAFEVLGAGAMALPDAVTEPWLARNRDSRLRATKGGKFGPDRFEIQGLRSVYDLLDGRKKVSDVLARYTDDAERARALRMLVLLELCELAVAA
jgi:serine/threonine protein kinase